MRRFLSFCYALFWLLLLLVCLSAAGLFYYAITPQTQANLPYKLAINKGVHLRNVAQQLNRAKLIKQPWAFVILAKVVGKSDAIKAGRYVLDKPLSPYQILQTISQGNNSQASLTLIEGWAWRKVKQNLRSQDSLQHSPSSWTDAQWLTALDASPEDKERGVMEGLLAPDTYFFARGKLDVQVLKRAYDLQQQRLKDAWEDRASDLPYKTPYEALIMASIVEKETALLADQPLIAGVFVNRLRANMRLQTDPTVIYGLGDAYNGNLTKVHLQTDTPYNSYTRNGLPPTPISMPSASAIQAALNPAKTKALYFVSKMDGTGESYFAETLTEHNRAVDRYIRGKK